MALLFLLFISPAHIPKYKIIYHFRAHCAKNNVLLISVLDRIGSTFGKTSPLTYLTDTINYFNFTAGTQFHSFLYVKIYYNNVFEDNGTNPLMTNRITKFKIIDQV